MTVVQLLIALIWTFLFQQIYRILFPPRRMLLVCGDRPAFHLMEKIHSREDKYYLETAIHIGVGIKAILEEAKKYDALIIGDIPAKDRNALLKKCFEQDIRTYTVPKLSDILIRTSQELDIFDSPLLLSRNDGISDLQRFIKRAMDFICSSIGIVVLSPFFLLGGAVDLPDRPRSGLLQADPSHRGRKRISDLQISDDDPERGGKNRGETGSGTR